MTQALVKTVMTRDEIDEWRKDWLLGNFYADAVLTDDVNDWPVYPGACVRTPLETLFETLLILRFNQLKTAAQEFLEAEADHGGFFHPEKLARKRVARAELIAVLACDGCGHFIDRRRQ